MHAIWSFLLDNDFLHAYTYGIIIQCIDGIERHVYPRIFTYSSDYPEKYVHLSCHWNLGTDYGHAGFFSPQYMTKDSVPARTA